MEPDNIDWDNIDSTFSQDDTYENFGAPMWVDLSDVWEFYRSSRMNNWRNLRKPLEMLLLLAEDTWVSSEVRDEFIVIGG